MRFVIVPELKGRWSWELRDAEGKALSRSTASYGDRTQVERAIETLRRDVLSARMLGPTGIRLDDLIATSSPRERTSE